MVNVENGGPNAGVLGELRGIGRRAGRVWWLVGNRHRIALIVAGVVMAVGAWFNAQIPVLLGGLATAVEGARRVGGGWGVGTVLPFLATMAVYYLIREGLQVLRRYLVHNTCTRVEKE